MDAKDIKWDKIYSKNTTLVSRQKRWSTTAYCKFKNIDGTSFCNSTALHFLEELRMHYYCDIHGNNNEIFYSIVFNKSYPYSVLKNVAVRNNIMYASILF